MTAHRIYDNNVYTRRTVASWSLMSIPEAQPESDFIAYARSYWQTTEEAIWLEGMIRDVDIQVQQDYASWAINFIIRGYIQDKHWTLFILRWR